MFNNNLISVDITNNVIDIKILETNIATKYQTVKL